MRVSVALAAVLLAAPARAQDAFEIQVYDSETAAPGEAGFELHLNYTALGEKSVPAPELPTHQVSRYTLEPHLGLTRWLEAGAYLQTALRPSGQFDYAGVKLRAKARVPKKLARGLIGLAINVEVASVPRTYEADRIGFEIRPIFDVRFRMLYFSLNPIVGLPAAGEHPGRPGFEPAATVLVVPNSIVRVGLEYYGAFAFDASQVHRLFAVLGLTHKAVDVLVGGGYGLAAGDRWTVKATVAVDLPSGSDRSAAW